MGIVGMMIYAEFDGIDNATRAKTGLMRIID
jgi:hypothetical protein